jgi:hypothetical protein
MQDSVQRVNRREQKDETEFELVIHLLFHSPDFVELHFLLKKGVGFEREKMGFFGHTGIDNGARSRSSCA